MAVINPSQYALNATALDRLIASLKARIGQFLGNQSILLAAQDRARALERAASGSSRKAAQVLVEKGGVLLKAQAETEKAAQDLLSRAATLQSKPTLPVYSFLRDAEVWNWGTRQYQLLGDLISETVGLASEATNMASRVSTMNREVSTYTSEVKQTEQAATGTGVVPKITAAISGTVGAAAGGLSKALWPIAIAGVAGLGLYAAVSGGALKKVFGR
jgi:hypothetical protein